MNVKRKTDSLMHYGIIGQKYGTRRYQLSNGTYTKEGNKRYRKKEEKEERETPERNIYTGERAKEVTPVTPKRVVKKTKETVKKVKTLADYIKTGMEAISKSTIFSKTVKETSSGVSSAYKDFFKYLLK